MKPLWLKLLNRINTAAGPYEMVAGSLADGIVYDCKSKVATYVEDLPEDLIHKWYGKKPRLTWSYHFGPANGVEATVCSLRSQSFGAFSQFIHPVLQYFPPGVKPEPQQIHPTDERHPASVWTQPKKGVSRLHVKDAWITLDWSDRNIVGALEFFRSYIEDAAGQFCKGEGDGAVTRGFDERYDPHLYNADFIMQLHDEDKRCTHSDKEAAVSRGSGRSCSECATMFKDNGGCEALATGGNPVPHIPSGCDNCEKAALSACGMATV